MNSTASRGLVVVVLVTCTMLLLWWFVPKPEDRGGYLVTSVVSGDTITVTRDGETHVVHLLGVKAPADGECGFDDARQYLVDGIQGVDVVLKPGPDVTTFEDGSWLRYVEIEGRDAGLALIDAGLAKADGTDHPRADQYGAAESKATPVCR